MPYIGRELDRGNYLKLDDISSQFNGTLTTFNLNAGGKAFYPGSPYSILVVLAGVVQEPETAYQINQATITFASAPLAGDQFFCIALGVALGVNVPANASVNGAQLAKPFNYDGYFYLDDVNNRVGIATATPQKPLHVVGEGQFDSVRVLGNLTVDGTTTTLDTVVTEVDKLEIGANNNTVAVAVTQSGSGDAAYFMGGDIGIGTNAPAAESGFTKVLHVHDDSPQVLLERETGSNDVKAGFNVWSGNASLETFTATPLRIRTSGNTNQLYLNTNGNIGIGTDDPDNHLHLLSTGGTVAKFESTNATSSLIRFVNASGANVYIGAKDTNEFFIRTGASERLRITSGGNVGIGSVTPQSQFEVYGSSPVIRSKHSTSQKYTQINHDGTDGYVDWSSGDLILRGASNSEKFRIKSDGNVGIGTGDPNYNLTIVGQDQAVMIREGNGALTSLSNNTSQKLWFQGGNAELGLFRDSSGNLEYILGTWQATTHIPIVFRTGNRAERMRITYSGNVQVNGGDFHIDDNGEFAIFEEDTSLAMTNSSKISMDYSGNVARIRSSHNGSAVSRPLAFFIGSSEKLRIASNGLVGIGTTIAQLSSAERLSVNQALTVLSYDSNTTGALYVRNANFSNANNPYIVFQDGSGNRGGVGIANNDSAMFIHGQNGIRFRYGGTSPGTTEAMRISNNGSVGIGTNNPTTKLTTSATHANGAVVDALRLTTQGTYSTSNSEESGAALSFGQFHETYSTWKTAQVVGIRDGATWHGALSFYTNSGGSQTDVTEKARLTAAGNLGIGEDTPVGLLHLNRDTQTTSSYASASVLRVDGSRGADELVGVGFNYYNSAGNIPQAFIGMKTKDWASYTNAHLVFATREVTTNSEPTERLRINHDGIINASMNTTAVALPTGTTAQRPSGTDAYIRKNSTNNALEFYNGTEWVEIITDYFPTGSTILG